MATTRMNNADREAVADAIADHKYAPLIKAAEEKRTELGDKIYDDVYSPEVRAWMAKAPAGALYTSTELNVAIAGQTRTVKFSSGRPIFQVHRGWGCRSKLYPAGHELAEAYAEVDTQTIRRARDKARNDVFAALSVFSSFEKAAQAWPEASTFIMARARTKTGSTSSGLPSVQLSALNAALDLPPEPSQPIGEAQPKA